jgi:probable F420-dependent oxidoreductase
MTTLKRRRYWGLVAPFMPANILAQTAKQQEDMGLEGTLASQTWGPPWISLAAAATTTSRLQLASAVALAFVRSPFETAMAAIDLDRISEGRFILGLGPTARNICEGVYGSVPYGKPLEHLRETVSLIRLIIAQTHTGEFKSFKGKYYNLDLSMYQSFRQHPPLRTDLPIWLSALQPRSVELGAEIANGIFTHPINSLYWAKNIIPEHIKVGLTRAGKQRADMHFCCMLWVTPNKDVKQSIEDGRELIAFFAGVKEYEPFFAANGFGAQARALQEGTMQGKSQDYAHLVSDEMVQTFVVTGTPDEVAAKIEPMWEVADSLCLHPPPFGMSPERIGTYLTTIAERFYL